ncbi:glycosyltransferase family 2 protein [Pontibacter beigongshangensis]|uniref:glycosyltransferase family 2 protein n=1 Tax=Pontibacter beigongshangensis TaxID=2574733 RepID=UPI00164FA8CC|nr:glycosyltransferase family 2 protein [Pontibacter beigongshangensis]
MAVVSIIIPNYNGAKYLADCIDSCINQGDCVREVIIVDDHSTDHSLSILKEYRSEYPELIQFYTNPGKGACAARNFGYLKSTGDFIQFLDSDDVLAPEKIRSQLNILHSMNYKDVLIHGMWGRFKDHFDNVYYWGPHESIRKDLKPADWLIANHMSMTGCWLTHRNLIKKGGLWDETLMRNQDGEFYSRLMLHASKVLFCAQAKVHYRSGNSGSVSSIVARPAMESLLKSLQLIENYIFSLEESPRARLSIADRYQDFVYANYIANPDLALFAESKVEELGGSNLKLPGGIMLKFLAAALGWKKALTIKKLITSSANS